MTAADLDRKSAAMERLRLQWWREIDPTIGSKVADAHAHAVKAITDSLKAMAEGRPTARKAARSPSFRAALARLDELWAWLAGPTTASLDGRLRDAREAFYREAFALHRPLIPAELLVAPDPRPTKEGVRLVRGAVIHGYDLRREIEGPFVTARRRLAAAVAMAGHRGATRATERDLLKAWRVQTAEAIRSAVLRALADSAEFADTEAGMDLIRPDFLEATV